MRVSGIVLNGPMGSGKDTLGAHIGNAYGYGKVSLAAPLYEIAEHAEAILRGRHADYRRARLARLLDRLLGDSRDAAGRPLEPVDSMAAMADVMRTASDSDILDPSVSKPRRFLQGIGSVVRTYRRSALPDDLVRRVLDRSLDTWLETGEFRFVVTDARTLDEMDDLRLAVGLLPRILGDDAEVRLVFVRINVSEETVVGRVSSRDGTPREDILRALQHPNELLLRSIPDGYFDRVIDGDRPLEAVYREADAMMRELGLPR